MNQNDLFRAFGDLDETLLDQSEAPLPRRQRGLRRWGALAACLALVLGLAGTAFAAEAREYSAAVAFFQDNGLSTAGLSRGEVKEVYRDITTQRFTSDKTAQVLERTVPGLEIDQREPSPEELEAAWNRNVWMNAQPRTGVSYRVDYEEKRAETLGFDVLDKSILSCYRGGDLIWTAEFPNLYVEDGVYTSAGTAVWGNNYRWSSEQPVYASLSRLDEDGKQLWWRQLDHGFTHEYISQVVDNGDGSWAVVSRGDFKYLCLSQYDIDGTERSSCVIDVGNYGIWNVVRLGDGYLAQLGNMVDGETARLVKLDRTGNVLDTFTYEGEDCNYVIKDMIEYAGRVYLSAYAVPKPTDDAGGRYEIAGILNDLFDRDIWEISSEELTPMLRDNYTAVLLLCSPEGGAPETFYSVKGSLGGALSVNGAGELVWEVESLVNSFFSPATNSFTIGGTCQVFRYAFDGGALLRQEDTGETVPYHR